MKPALPYSRGKRWG